jgi:hypothetical protein
LEKVSSSEARIIITNLAKTSVLLQLLQLRNVSSPMPFEKRYLNDPLVGGTAWSGGLGEQLLGVTGPEFHGPIAASASFYAAGRLYRTDWFRFNVEVRAGRFERIQAATIPARRVRVLVPHQVRKFRKPMVNDVAKEVVETTRSQH